MIKDIENLDQFYDTKVLAIPSTTKSKKPTVSFKSTPTIFNPKVFKAKYSTGKIPWGPNGAMIHPRGPDGRRLDDKESESSDGSWYPGRDARPDTPKPETPQQAKAWSQEMWVKPR
jgi:hypothetical protein